jgi:hypothetical protein
MRTRTARILVATVVAAVGVILPVAPAYAATSGCGSVCDGKDPETYYAQVDGGSGRCGYPAFTSTLDTYSDVELRYSSYCRTAWARDTNPGVLAYVTIESYSANGTLRKVYKGGSWTSMVNDKNLKARACKYHWKNEAETNKPARRVGCTGKF